jgi:hypothetical protein
MIDGSPLAHNSDGPGVHLGTSQRSTQRLVWRDRGPRIDQGAINELGNAGGPAGVDDKQVHC